MIKDLSLPELSLLDFSNLVLYSRFRRYPAFSTMDLAAILKADIAKAVDVGALLLANFGVGSTVSILGCIGRREWDSDHFGISMHELQLHHANSADSLRLDEIVSSLLAAPGLEKGAHVAAEIDIDDYSGLNVLLRHGFEVMDIRRTYCTNKMRQDIDFIRMGKRVRSYDSADYDEVMTLVRQTSFPSRFSRDSTISPDKVSSMYERWFKGLLDAHGVSSNVVVYERGGEVVGCGAIGEKDFSYAGIDRKLRTGSVYAGRSDAVGAYSPVLYRLIIDALKSHGLVDTTASMNNVVVCRVIESFRSYKSAVASYALRKIM